jgi:hypothetical protein
MSTIIHHHSLSKTVDAVNEAFFFRRPILPQERRRVASWIASRQHLPGSYGELFAGFPSERESGIRVFTGERITSASARHILGEEACRALWLLDSNDGPTAGALARATRWMIERVDQAVRDSPRNSVGTFCCGKCTVGLWRHTIAGGLDWQDERLEVGLATLRAARV